MSRGRNGGGERAMRPSSSRSTHSTKLSFAPKTTIRRGPSTFSRSTPSSRIPSLAMIRRDAKYSRRGTARRPSAADDVEAVAEHCTANFSRKTRPRAAGAPTGCCECGGSPPPPIRPSPCRQRLGNNPCEELFRLVLKATTDQRRDKLDRRRRDRHIAPVGFCAANIDGKRPGPRPAHREQAGDQFRTRSFFRSPSERCRTWLTTSPQGDCSDVRLRSRPCDDYFNDAVDHKRPCYRL